MRRFWKFVRRYWFIPLLVVGGIVVYVLLCRWRPGSQGEAFAATKAELEAINAGAEADHVRINMGTTEALKHVNEKYADRRAKLTEKQENRAKKLENDPEALARFIVKGTEP